MFLFIAVWFFSGIGSTFAQKLHSGGDDVPLVALTNTGDNYPCNFEKRVGDYGIFSCTTSGSISFARTTYARLLVVGGGGGGGGGTSGCGEGGGGGGAGGYLEITSAQFNPGVQYSLTIGGGGASDKSGSTTSITTLASTYSAIGGGKGASSKLSGGDGASGGGGNGCESSHSGGSATGGGNAGGKGNTHGTGGGGGGAGGAGTVGGTSVNENGSGGAGKQWYDVFYAAGGGGGGRSGTEYGKGGSSIGGNGGDKTGVSGKDALQNTGSGGGGGGGSGQSSGGSGASGVVMMAFVYCKAGYWHAQPTDAVCTICPAGKYSSAGSGSCSECPAGSFAASSGSVSCDGCLAGYLSTAGSTSCSQCVPGSYSSPLTLYYTYYQAPSNGLQLYYRFDSVSGSRVGNLAILQNGEVVYDAILQNGATVAKNQLFLSSANSQYMSINSFTTGTTGLTFATWWRSDNSGSDNSRIFDFGNGAGSDNIILRSYTGGTLRACVYINNQQSQLATSVAFNNGNAWNHVAWTLDPSGAGTWIVYINGIKVVSAASMPYPRSVLRSINYLGKSNWDQDTYLNGGMKDFRMYNRVLSATDVNTLFVSTQTIFVSSQCPYCPPGQYSFSSAAGCYTCPTGHYSTLGSSSCTACPAGSFAALTGSVSCDSCLFGYFSTAGSKSCSQCLPGSYSPPLSLVYNVSKYSYAPSNGLQLYYRFDSISGSSVGNIASGSVIYDATLQNGATVPSNHLFLSAVNSQYMSINPFTTGTTGLTFATWWKSDSTGSPVRIMDFGNGPLSDKIELIHNPLDRTIVAQLIQNSEQKTTFVAPFYFDTKNAWNHVAWLLDPSGTGTWAILINGIYIAQKYQALFPRSVLRSNNFLGKNDRADGAYFNETIKDFRMYNRMLTPSEINMLFFATQTLYISQCLICPAGQYSSAISQPSCSICPAGQYSSFAGSTKCDSCSSFYSGFACFDSGLLEQS